LKSQRAGGHGRPAAGAGQEGRRRPRTGERAVRKFFQGTPTLQAPGSLPQQKSREWIALLECLEIPAITKAAFTPWGEPLPCPRPTTRDRATYDKRAYVADLAPSTAFSDRGRAGGNIGMLRIQLDQGTLPFS